MSRCGEALKAQPSRCVSILSRSAAFPPSLVEVTAGQRPAHSERKRASFVFFKVPMIAVAGLSIRQGRRVFPTVKPVSRTAGAKTQPSGRAAS